MRRNPGSLVPLQPEVEADTKAHPVAADLAADLVVEWVEEVAVARFTSPTFVTLPPLTINLW